MNRSSLYIPLLLILFFLTTPLLSAIASSPPDSLDYTRDTTYANDTTYAKDTTYVSYYLYSNDSLALQKLHLANTYSLDAFQRFDPLQQNGGFFASLGNPGLACNDLVYHPDIQAGFNLGLNSFQKYTFTDKNTAYYIHQVPITFLTYINGSKKEQLFRAFHNQHIGKNITLGVDFFLINSPGLYVRQKSDDKSVTLNGQYFTKNKRYGIIANYTHNKFIVQENGGILNDSVFENNLETDRQLIDVNLKTAQNLVKEAGFYTEQYFSFTKADTLPDSLYTRQPFFNPGRITYSFKYDKNIQVYTDQEPESDFYKQFYSRFGPLTDSTQTRDSILVVSMTHRLGWSNIGMNEDPEKKILYLRISAEHQHSEISGYAAKTQFNILTPSADVIIRPLSGMKVSFNGYYSKGDFNDGGYLLFGSLHQKIKLWLNKEIDFSIITYQLSQDAAYFYQHYKSNYFNWDNNFKKQLTQNISFNIQMNKLNLGIDYMKISHFIYLYQEARPWQNPGTFNLFRARLSQHLQIKTFNFDYKLVYQHASNSTILPLPDLLARGAVYFTLHVFKNAAVLQPGIDMFYNTAYYADAYMPATRSFYLQEGKKIGNYLYADVYLNLMIKSFRLFLKYNHFTSLFGENNYYMVPHYPMQDAKFKFGLTWDFYN